MTFNVTLDLVYIMLKDPIPSTRIPEDFINSYLDLTRKQISFKRWSDLSIQKDRTLVMANTRRKAVNIFHKILKDFPDAMYQSTGIKKQDRINILRKLDEKEKSKEKFILVSTQVVEAGVNISFSNFQREGTYR